MTGLDQEMMQKNISVNHLQDSQKNMITLSILQGVVVFIFLILGGLAVFVCSSSKGGSFVTQSVGDGKQQTQFILDGKNVLGISIFPQIAFQLPATIYRRYVYTGFDLCLVSQCRWRINGAYLFVLYRYDWAENEIRRGMKVRKNVRMTVHLRLLLVFYLCYDF